MPETRRPVGGVSDSDAGQVFQPAVRRTLAEVLGNPLVGQDAGTSLYAICRIVRELRRQKDVPPALQSVILLLSEAATLGSLVSFTASIGGTTRNDLAKAIVEARMVLTGEAAGTKRSSVVSDERHGATVLAILDEASAEYDKASDADKDGIVERTASALESLVGFGLDGDANTELPRIVAAPGPGPLVDLTKDALDAMRRRGRPPEGTKPKNAIIRDLMALLGVQRDRTEARSFNKFLIRCRERMRAGSDGPTADKATPPQRT